MRSFALLPVFLASTLLVANSSSIAGIYKYIDEDGQVAYSDKPVDGAEKMKIRERAPRPEAGFDTNSNRGQGPEGELSEQVEYESLEILTPRNDRVIADRTGSVEVILLPTPRLADGHELIIVVDGKDISRGRHANVTLSQVPRGSHKVSARILDSGGQTLMTSPTVTFHVKRPIIDKDSPLAYDNDN